MSDTPIIFDELRTPLQITNRLSWVTFYLRKATATISAERAAYVKLKEDYSKAFKRARLDAVGTVAEREDQAYLATADLHEQMSIAEMALQYSKEKKADLQDELSTLQTEAGLVKIEMQMAGRG